jgi:hypothetical protein
MLKDTVKILNPLQASLYVKHGVKPIDLFWNDGFLIFVFRKEQTRELHKLWLERKLK